MAACSQKCVREHINDLPVRQEHINRFLTPARYREHVDMLKQRYPNTFDIKTLISAATANATINAITFITGCGMLLNL